MNLVSFICRVDMISLFNVEIILKSIFFKFCVIVIDVYGFSY